MTQVLPINCRLFIKEIMKYFFLLNLLFLMPLPYGKKSQTEADRQIQSKALNKVTNQEKTRNKTKIASKKSKKVLNFGETYKSTALIISGIDGSETGGGFFIAKNLLVTNRQVLKNALVRSGFKIVLIETQQGIKDIGFVFAEDTENDLAIIKTVKKIHKPLKLGKYNKVRTGDKIFVLSPKGFVGTFWSKGTISAKRELSGSQVLQIKVSISQEDNKKFGGMGILVQDILQITVPISQEDNGSPVLSEDSKVIGIAVSVLKGDQNISFVMPVIYLKKLIKALREELIKISTLNLKKILEDDKIIAFIKNKNFYKRANYRQAFHRIKKSAKQGNAEAQFLLGEMYSLGQGVSKDDKQAFYWIKKSAKQGNAEAQFLLWEMYSLGQGVSKDDKQAFYWTKKSAKQGNAEAQLALGLMYLDGSGVSRDNKQAFYWIRKSAKQGNTYAQATVGGMYSSGQGVSKDNKQAFYWMKKAAETGNVTFQSALGSMYYYNGEAVPKNLIYAYLWLNLAVSNGDEDAARLRNQISTEMSSEQIAVAQVLSIQKAKEINKRKLDSRQ